MHLNEVSFRRDTRLLWVVVAVLLGIPGVLGTIAMMRFGLVSRADYLLLLFCASLASLAFWLAWKNAISVRDHPPAIALANGRVHILQPLGRPAVDFEWSEVAAIRMVRSYFSYGPGQMSISLTDDGARRLGLGGYEARPGGPGMTDRAPPRRWHVVVPIGSISEGWQQVLEAFDHAANDAGYAFDFELRRFGIGSRRLWKVVPKT